VHVERVAAGEVHDEERAAAAHRLVHHLVDLGRGGEPLLEHARRLRAVVHEDVVRCEAGDVRRDDRHLPELAQHRHHPTAERVVAGEDDLHRERLPGREERVIDEAPLGVLRAVRDPRPRQARGGEADEAVGGDHALEVSEDGALRLQPLGGRLEDVAAPRELLELERRHELLPRRLGVLRRELPARQRLLQVLLDPGDARVERLLADVMQEHRAAALRDGGEETVGEVWSDRARPDDSDDHAGSRSRCDVSPPNTLSRSSFSGGLDNTSKTVPECRRVRQACDRGAAGGGRAGRGSGGTGGRPCGS